MKTPEELKKIVKEVSDKKKKEYQDYLKIVRDTEEGKKKLMIELAKKDLNRNFRKFCFLFYPKP